jgi:hypothetical protein
MTLLKIPINGNWFEIRVDDGLRVEIEDGLLTVHRERSAAGKVLPFVDRRAKDTGSDDGPNGR